MRKKLVVGNWKMNKTVATATATVKALRGLMDPCAQVDVAICPPLTALDAVRTGLEGSQIALGAQDVFWMAHGAFTGSVSAEMLADHGCTYCIVGHSETRGRFGKLEVPGSTISYFNESNETVNLKVRALVEHAIRPILCVGETLFEREAGATDGLIEAHLMEGLSMVEAVQFQNAVVAYEPVWAIGTGHVCAPEEASRICGLIRGVLRRRFSESAASSIRILYGGSVKPSNAHELFMQNDIDGGLVGGASLDPAEFSQIVSSAL